MTATLTLPAPGERALIGRSHAGRDIELYARGSGDLAALLIGGVHGDETEGFLFAERYLAALDSGEIKLDPRLRLYICPRLNPDGCAAVRRTNHRNVDLNRNLPTRDWAGEFTNVRYYPGAAAGSEPESTATLAMIDAVRPAVIISLHSYENPMVNFNGPCEDLATAMGAANGLPPKGDIGYPTPGSLGTYAGWERNLPTLTLEILRGQAPDEVWRQHRDGMGVALEFYLSHPQPAR